ncbi:MAG: Fic family protein [Eggerthellales bacterium]|nr:Fic family protein [Eggerthellales bacterium]
MNNEQYMKVSQAAKLWGITDRAVRKMCSENRIEGVIRKGNLYMIPKDAPHPIDHRTRWGKQVNPEYERLFAEIESKKARLDHQRPLTAGEAARLRNEFMIEFTYDSNAIEGNTLTLQETAMVLEGITIDRKPLKDHLEAVGHRDAFAYVESIAAEESPLSEHVIKAIHSLVLIDRPDDRGVYRKIPVRIMGAETEPVQPYLVEPKMQELLLNDAERKKVMHPIERIARFHLEFECIHPFIDGNGRSGRLIANLDLIREGYPPINVKFADRMAYYQAFNAYSQDKNPAPMVNLMGGYVLERLEQHLGILG